MLAESELQNAFLALLFASEQVVQPAQIQATLQVHFQQDFSLQTIEKIAESTQEHLKTTAMPFEILKIAQGFQLMTTKKYHQMLEIFIQQQSKKKLSTASLETLAIVAYRQPITKAEIEQIRGVGADYAVQKLLEKELIVILGKSEQPGRPLIYGTSEKFLAYMGIHSLQDLPKAKDFMNKTDQQPVGDQDLGFSNG